MKAKHHFWSSLAAGGALYWATGSGAALTGCMIGGFLIDADHIIDQLWSIGRGAPFRKKAGDIEKPTRPGLSNSLVSVLRPRKLVRLPLIFHSFELLIVIAALAFNQRTPFLIGLSAGYALHIALDLSRHYHEFRSPMFYLLLYRLAQRFRRDQLIKPEYL